MKKTVLLIVTISIIFNTTLQSLTLEKNETITKTMSYDQTKVIEDNIKSLFLSSNEVHFIFNTPKHGQKTIIIKDESILKEFANSFRFNAQVTFNRIPKDMVPSLAIYVMIQFPEKENASFFSSSINLHSLNFTQSKENDIEWCEVDLSLNTVLLYNYYFSSVLPIWYEKRHWHGAFELNDYKKDYYSTKLLQIPPTCYN
jgi:hypothetical protein